MSFVIALDLAKETAFEDVRRVALDIALMYVNVAPSLGFLGFSPIVYYDGEVNPQNIKLVEKTFGTEVYYALISKTIDLMRKGIISTSDHLGLLGKDYQFRIASDTERWEVEWEYLRLVMMSEDYYKRQLLGFENGMDEERESEELLNEVTNVALEGKCLVRESRLSSEEWPEPPFRPELGDGSVGLAE